MNTSERLQNLEFRFRVLYSKETEGLSIRSTTGLWIKLTFVSPRLAIIKLFPSLCDNFFFPLQNANGAKKKHEKLSFVHVVPINLREFVMVHPPTVWLQ